MRDKLLKMSKGLIENSSQTNNRLKFLENKNENVHKERRMTKRTKIKRMRAIERSKGYFFKCVI